MRLLLLAIILVVGRGAPMWAPTEAAIGNAVGGHTGPPLQTARSTQALPFIDDDYARARAEARSRKLPLFVEVWAPW